MVKKFFKIIHKEFSGLHEAALLLGLSALASQVLALLRDHLLAKTFGAGQTLDVYYAAFRIPDLVYVTIASFVSVMVLIPLLIDKIGKNDNKAAKEFMDSVFTVFCAVMVGVSVILYFLIPWLTRLTAPGFSSAEQVQLILFTRILLFSPFLLGISNLLGSVTQSLRKFLIYALSPLLYNVGIILGVTVLYPTIGPTGLVWGVAIGALMHLAIQLPVLAERGFFPGFTRKINWPMIRQVVGVSLPRTLTLATAQLDDLVLLSMASLFATGSIAIFSFSYNLQAVPLAIVGVSYSVAAFPQLAKLYAQGQKKEFLSQISDTVRHIAFWSFLSSVLFIVLRAQVVRVILGAGRFNWADTRLTAACLALFAISVIGQSLCLLFVRGYYAAGKTYKPLFINIICTGLVIALAFIFSDWYRSWPAFKDLLETILRVKGLPDTQILVLPLAFSVGFIVNSWLHWIGFEREFGKLPGGVGRSFLQSLFAAVTGGVVSYEMLNILEGLPTRTVAGIFLQGFAAGLAGIAIFAAVLVLLNNSEIKEVGRALGSRFWKRKPVVAEQETL